MSENSADSLTHLLDSPIVPLRPEWTVPERVEQLAAARALDGPDAYWEWVARQQRWSTPWTSVRTGEIDAFRYFEGGRLNVADNCVDRWAEDPATADRAAVVWEGEPGDTRTVTYAELAGEVSRLAAGLLGLGVRKGDVVAIYMPNLVEAFTTIHACNRIGAIYTVLFSGFGEEAVASRLQAARATVVVVADAIYRRTKPVPLLETLRAARTRTPSVRATVVVDRTGEDVPLGEGEHAYADVLESGAAGTPAVPLDPNEPSFLIFTSGTESKPKGVVHSVGGFLLGTWANAHWQAGYEPGDVYWVAADVGWLTFPIQAVVGGLACGMTIACYEGALDTPTTSRFYEVCERHAVTKVLCAPTLVRMLRKFGDDLAAAHPLPGLKLVTVQGEPLDGDTFGWATATLGVPVVNAYGQTETGSTWTYPVYGAEDLKAGSVGTPVPGHSFEILDDDGAPVAPGVKGNLVLTSPFPTLARTVWDDHDRYLSTYFSRFPGKYATNDEAVLDHDGHLWVLGRADDVINVAAHRISTMEIEAVVTAHPDVVEAAVVGVPDDTKGTVPIAFVTLREGAGEGAAEQIRARVVGEMGGYARLDRIFVTPAMPKTRTGKTMRRLLRDVVVHGGATGDTSAMDDPAALDAVAAVVAAQGVRA
ncbi:AMP-binding protein [Pseudonocardia sp. KRD-184]|uniref:AMP-binding protein n=1 Tax=Pseudonocardia oceani TaxID=2792013 RepID=A0ABS6UG14_9PSEU|nr:AMP-binding protein [Pseudonocardia oceani]MBW0096357.1 AMP-binding protein [Pseudonocardia oceani]MBW0109118.1 AMP-binding protein [Pseudonocardia oceani]MBW0123269.1 AMP-binding protein [Pseudonocardia oceani]MBW0130799.1 AMP-binding protein [Pseudonocardia oceani]